MAGHVLECGAQATGGNYAFFEEVPGLERPGLSAGRDAPKTASCVITKHPGTGGLVSVGTVTAQLLYEIEGPRYPTPDVVARFDTIRLQPDGPDRVRIEGVRGEPAPAAAKVAINLMGGYRNGMTLVLDGPRRGSEGRAGGAHAPRAPAGRARHGFRRWCAAAASAADRARRRARCSA